MAYKLTKRGYKKPPAGYDYIEPFMMQLEEEMKRGTCTGRIGNSAGTVLCIGPIGTP